MCLTTFELDKLHISSSVDNLKLSILSAVGVRSHSALLDGIRSLTSGNVWVSRGVACRIDVQISFNGNRLGRSRIVEVLGEHIRDAQIWSQLSLSTTLEIPHSEDPKIPMPDISIHINYSNEASLVGSSSDMMVPEPVLCAQFEHLKLHLNFDSIRSLKPTKKPKFCVEEPDTEDTMLLDDCKTSGDTTFLENTVRTLSEGLCNTTKTCFDDDPQLVIRNSIFTNDLTLSSHHPEHEDEDEMLLSPTIDDTSSLTQRTTISSTSSTTSTVALKRPNDFEECEQPLRLTVTPATKLINMGMRTLIGGYGSRGPYRMQGLQVRKPPPDINLSMIAPSMFCPGFKDIMARNAEFLPTISRAFSITLPRNVLSPRLEKKLANLANLNTVSFMKGQQEKAANEPASTKSLSDVVYARIWGMMQRKLYDPSAARKLKPEIPNLKDQCLEDIDEDFLSQSRQEGIAVRELVMKDLEEFIIEARDEDEESLFDDLLADGEDGKLIPLGDFEESLTMMQETDEMFFGDGFNRSCNGIWDEFDDAIVLIFKWKFFSDLGTV
ncbi:hypothetical protein B7494_g8263 [Chlorociboria aeruginascens]|nr:hypothetical protein B7494_g8263 [Chlorociboria aeruginascens]